MKLISFSLYNEGSNIAKRPHGRGIKKHVRFENYTVGAIENAKIARELFSEFVCRFYVQDDMEEVIENLRSEGAGVILRKNNYTAQQPCMPMMWRNEPLIDDDFEICLFRDTDSRLSLRERVLIDKFMESNKKFHVIRDHRCHREPIMGGMWGAKKTDKKIATIIKNVFKEPIMDYGTDQNTFKNKIWPIIKPYTLVHDSRRDNSDFIPNPDGSHIGQIIPV